MSFLWNFTEIESSTTSLHSIQSPHGAALIIFNLKRVNQGPLVYSVYLYNCMYPGCVYLLCPSVLWDNKIHQDWRQENWKWETKLPRVDGSCFFFFLVSRMSTKRTLSPSYMIDWRPHLSGPCKWAEFIAFPDWRVSFTGWTANWPIPPLHKLSIEGEARAVSLEGRWALSRSNALFHFVQAHNFFLCRNSGWIAEMPFMRGGLGDSRMSRGAADRRLFCVSVASTYHVLSLPWH